MMLNAMTPSVADDVCSVTTALPQLASGHTVVLGKERYTVLKKVASGGFGTIYTCKHGENTKVLKVSASQKMCSDFTTAQSCVLYNNTVSIRA